MLPDDYLLLGGAEELVAGFDAEGFKEGHYVAEGHIHSVFGQGVYVADGEVAFLLVAHVGGPDVGVVEIECLAGGEAVDEGIGGVHIHTLAFL